MRSEALIVVAIIVVAIASGCGDNYTPGVPSTSIAVREVGGACAISTDSALWCWGSPTARTLDESSDPIPVDSSTWAHLANPLGSVSCGVHDDGTAWCWGNDTDGQVGASDDVRVETYVPAPVMVVGDSWATLSTGYVHTCGIRMDGTLWCWGSNDDLQVGHANSFPSPPQCSDNWKFVCTSPVMLDGSDWTEVSAGGRHTCAIKSDGSLWCWGFAYTGDLGVPGIDPVSTPTLVPDSSWSHVTAGFDETCGIQPDHSLWCWGDNRYGQLAASGIDHSSAPLQIPGEWLMVSVSNHACAITMDHSLFCWGSNMFGEVSAGAPQIAYSPVQIPGSWQFVSAAGTSTCAIRDDASLSCWGNVN